MMWSGGTPQVLGLSEFACLPSISPTSMRLSLQTGWGGWAVWGMGGETNTNPGTTPPLSAVWRRAHPARWAGSKETAGIDFVLCSSWVQVSWKFHGRPLTPSISPPRVEVTTKLQGQGRTVSTLTLTNASRAHNGTYSCQARCCSENIPLRSFPFPGTMRAWRQWTSSYWWMHPRRWS